VLLCQLGTCHFVIDVITTNGGKFDSASLHTANPHVSDREPLVLYDDEKGSVDGTCFGLSARKNNYGARRVRSLGRLHALSC